MNVPSSYVNGIVKCEACAESFKATLQSEQEQTGIVRREGVTRIPAPKLGAGLFLLLSHGEQRGPFTYSQLQSMWQTGAITADAMYWQDGLDDWNPIARLSLDRPVPSSPPAAQQIIYVKQSRSGCSLILIIALGIVVGLVLLSLF
jgi:hypothetical protein